MHLQRSSFRKSSPALGWIRQCLFANYPVELIQFTNDLRIPYELLEANEDAQTVYRVDVFPSNSMVVQEAIELNYIKITMKVGNNRRPRKIRNPNVQVFRYPELKHPSEAISNLKVAESNHSQFQT